MSTLTRNKKTWKTNVLWTMRNKDLRFFSCQTILKFVEYFKREYGTGKYVLVAGVSLSYAAGLKVSEKYVRGLIE